MEFRDIKTWIAKQSPSLQDVPPREESGLVSFHCADIQTSQTSCLWLSINRFHKNGRGDNYTDALPKFGMRCSKLLLSCTSSGFDPQTQLLAEQ
jgi:hypothetical protein